jgi:hypothetical protein
MSEASNSADEKSWWLDVLEKGTRASTPHDEKLWWYAVLELDRQIGRSNVHADEAALLLAGHDPSEANLEGALDTNTPDVTRADMRRLHKEFQGRPPAPMAEWLAVARKAGLVVHPVVAQIVDDPSAVVIRKPDHDLMRTPSGQSAAVDYSLLACPEQLIQAFGTFTGMNAEWFEKARDSRLEKARRVPGRGGRHSIPAMYCPMEVMLWLIDPKRKKKSKPLSEETGWRLLEQHFPKVFAAHASADPRVDSQG